MLKYQAFPGEAGPTGFHLYDYLTQKGIPCLVVSPLSIPKASNERVKNNRIDSGKIAQHFVLSREEIDAIVL